jgi:hypothetical protein
MRPCRQLHVQISFSESQVSDEVEEKVSAELCCFCPGRSEPRQQERSDQKPFSQDILTYPFFPNFRDVSLLISIYPSCGQITKELAGASPIVGFWPEVPPGAMGG